MEEMTSIKEILDTFGRYTGLTMGSSMWPLIHQQQDNIIVVKPVGRLKKYDIPVYIVPGGKYVMHRIIDVKDDHYVVLGDGLTNLERVTDDMICGKLIGFYKKGKRYIDLEKNIGYKIYSRVWVALRFARPAILYVKHGFGWIKRHIFKKDV